MANFAGKGSSVAMAAGLMIILISSIFSSAQAYAGIGWNQLGNFGTESSFRETNILAANSGGKIGIISLDDDEDDEGEEDDEEEDDEQDDEEKVRGSSGKGNKNKDKDNDNRGKSKGKDNNAKDNDDENDKDDRKKKLHPLLQPVPSSLESFELVAEGVALAKRDGRDGPFTDASLNIRGFTEREEGNHFRFHATGSVDLADGGEYDIVDAKGIIIFFKNARGANHVAGLLHIVGKTVVDEDGNDIGKFKLRAWVLGQENGSDTWRIIVFPAGKLGPHIMLINMDGTITGLTGPGTSPPGIAALHHFVVSTIPSPVASGSGFNVTVTAHMSNGTLLKSYEGRAKVTDLTGSVKPSLTPRFQDGVFKGALNITKAVSTDNVTFADVETGKKGTSNSFAVFAGPLKEIEVTPSEANTGLGGKVQLTARGFDKFGNEISGLGFVWSLSSSDFGSISTAGNKANFTASSSLTSTAKVNVTAAVGAISDKSLITISPTASQALDHFIIGNITSPQTAGSAFSITVSAVNASGGTIIDYAGPMKLSDTTGALNMTVGSGFASGVWTGNVNITIAASDVKITANYVAAPAKIGTSNEFDVVAGSLHHFEIGSIANQTAGTQFNIVVKAKDAFGNVKKDHQGNVTLSTNDGASPMGNLTSFVPNPYNFTAADAGEHTFAVTMYNAKENVTITVTGSGKSGTSNEFDVNPAAVSTVTVSPTSVTVSPGASAVFNAQAHDVYGNEVEGAEFNWTLNLASLGTLDVDSDTDSAEFVAAADIAVLTTGNVTAQVGSISDSAGITVSV